MNPVLALLLISYDVYVHFALTEGLELISLHIAEVVLCGIGSRSDASMRIIFLIEVRN
jgi:hypothetical protein